MWILSREYRLLSRLEGIDGVPEVYGWLDRYAFFMERLPAERMRPAPPADRPRR